MWNKSKIIIGDNTPHTEPATHEIICFFTDIHYYGDNGKQENGKEERGEELL